jgi:DNA/RNA endonuclease YhcR with UshA esterase domain
MKKKRIIATCISIFMLVTVIVTFSEHFIASSGWNGDIRLTSDDLESSNPVVAVAGNNIHVLWQDNRDGNYEVYYKRSTDNGENWGSDTRLTSDDSGSWVPVVAVDGNNIHVIWQEDRDRNYEVYYKRSTDNGENWGSDTRLTSDDSISAGPVVAVDGNNIHVLWQDNRDGNYEVYYKRSTDNGENWGSDTRLTINGDNIHVVWQDDRDGNYEVYYKRSTDNGENWGSDTRLTSDDSGSWVPVVAVNGDNIHVVWQDRRDGNYEVYYKRSTDNGENWGSDTRLTSDDSTSAGPVVEMETMKYITREALIMERIGVAIQG